MLRPGPVASTYLMLDVCAAAAAAVSLYVD